MSEFITEDRFDDDLEIPDETFYSDDLENIFRSDEKKVITGFYDLSIGKSSGRFTEDKPIMGMFHDYHIKDKYFKDAKLYRGDFTAATFENCTFENVEFLNSYCEVMVFQKCQMKDVRLIGCYESDMVIRDSLVGCFKVQYD